VARHDLETKYLQAMHVATVKEMDEQQMTALHMIASSRNVFDISFSRAKPRLLPSEEG